MNSKDPKGYYSQLEVQFDASETEIRTAFRKKAAELHPDRNPSADATEKFQSLIEAYSVLSDSIAREAYDTHNTDKPALNRIGTVHSKPVTCSVCGNIAIHPRYIIYSEVRSFILKTQQTPVEGIFCFPCSEKKVIKASLVTWFFGWWGIPWGPIISVQAIIQNLLGGKEPFYRNARALKQQADFILELGNSELATTIATDALKYAKKGNARTLSNPKNRDLYSDELLKLEHEIEAFLKEISKNQPADSSNGPSKSKYSWRPKNSFLLQLGFIIIACSALMIGLSKPPSPIKPSSSQFKPAFRTQNSFHTSSQQGDNELSWPVNSGYISGYEKKFTDGHSTVTVDNSHNSSDVFVKIFSLDNTPPIPARVFFIKAYDQFIIADLQVGNYDVRYRELGTGALLRSDPFKAEEFRTKGEISFSKLTIKLSKINTAIKQAPFEF